MEAKIAVQRVSYRMQILELMDGGILLYNDAFLLIIMAGTMPQFWQHEVPKTKMNASERINLTFTGRRRAVFHYQQRNHVVRRTVARCFFGGVQSSHRLKVEWIRFVSKPRVSAGLLMYRIQDGKLQVLLAHPGGPLFKSKDEGFWTIPKGEIELGEDMLETAKREFEEETGVMPNGPFHALTPIKQKGGKIVHAWAFKGDCDPAKIVSNTFTMEWPPKSGRKMDFPEIDRADFFDVAAASRKIKAPQMALVEECQQNVLGNLMVQLHHD